MLAVTQASEGVGYSARTRALLTIAGPFGAGICFLLLHEHAQPLRLTAALTVWVAIWWLTKFIDAVITALLPLALLAASLGFMLPVATAPNAIAYGTSMVSSRQMLRAGWFVDLFGVRVLALISWIAFGK